MAEPQPAYRSVLTQRFLAQLDDCIDYATRQGRWYWDRHYRNYVHFTPEPFSAAPGVGIPAGSRTPEHALDSMLVAEADADAHVFAVSRATVEAQVRAGEFLPLERCEHRDCENLRTPRDSRCALHRGLATARR